MKNKYTPAITVIAIGLALTLFAVEKQADRPSAETVSPSSSNERLKAEVLKVFSAKDGDALFRAYLVKWKGQEIVASDQLVKSDYHVGDTIQVLAINLPFPNGQRGPRLLSFHVPPQ